MRDVLRTLTDSLCESDMGLDSSGVYIIGLSSVIVFFVGCARMVCVVGNVVVNRLATKPA